MVFQNVSFDEAVRMFEVYCRARGLAHTTTNTYSYAHRQLRHSLCEEAQEVEPPTRNQLRAFITHMLDAGLARTTIRIRMRSIRVFANFLERDRITEQSPMTGVEIPRVPITFPQVLSCRDIQRLLQAARSGTWYGIRNHGMIGMLCDTGLRLSELVNLDVSDMDLGGQSVRVRHGKGGKERRVYMGRTLTRAIRRWVDVHPFFDGCEVLFCTRDGRRLNKRNVARILERTATRAGLTDRRIHPHLLRHTFATHFIKNGGDPFTLQRLLGHSDIKTTMIYVNLAGADLVEGHAKARPVDRLLSR